MQRTAPPLHPHEIRWLRRVLGMTQAKFGSLFGRDAATIFRWENGDYNPDLASSAILLRLWNDVRHQLEQRRLQEAQQAQQKEALQVFAGGLILGGLIGYLIKASDD